MTQAEMLQLQMMDLLFAKLQNLTDRELVVRKQIETELQGNVKKINKEMERRNRDE